LSGWDKAMMAQLNMDLPDLTAEFFREAEIDDLLGIAHAAAALKDPTKEQGWEEAAEASAALEPRSAPGVVWRMGRHRLICGKAEDPASYLSLFKGSDAQVDLLLTDPPYNADVELGTQNVRDPIRKKGKRAGQGMENDRIDQDDYKTLLTDSLALAAERMRPGACWYVFGPSCGESMRSFTAALWSTLGFNRQSIVWVKDRMVFGPSDYQWKHEVIYYGWAPIERGKPHHRSDDRTQTTVWEIANQDWGKGDLAHPSRKPVELAARMIGASCPKGGLVLDPFAGGGWSFVAGEQLDRTVYGIELRPEFCDLAIKAWEAVSGQTAELEDPRD
jgi:DNA modification methylase